VGYPDSASQHRGRELLRIEMYVDVEFTSPSGVGPVVRERRCDRSEPEEEDQNRSDAKGVRPIQGELYNPHHASPS